MKISFKEIEILVSQLYGFDEPKVFLEQYETDGKTVSFFLQKAYQDLSQKYVVDLGCGTGILTFAAAFVDAKFVLGVDVDISALKIALKNKKILADLGFSLTVDFLCADVKNLYLKKKFDVCIMNPPFGIQRKGADRIFLKKAFEISDVVWCFLSQNSEPFVRKFSEENGFHISSSFKTKIQLRRKFFFHKKDVEFLPVDIYRIERK
jgi:putative methylase